MQAQASKMTIPAIGYQLIIENMDARKARAIVKALDVNGPCTLSEKTGPLVEMAEYLEEMGVEKNEIVIGLEVMEQNDHDTAHFGTFGTFIFSEFKGLKQ